jgi:hypothetical protein
MSGSSSPADMWSTIVMFVLTFAILGLLLGIAEVYDRTELEEDQVSDPEFSGGNSTFPAAEAPGPEMKVG